MRYGPKMKVLGALVLLLTLIVACGGDDEDSTGDTGEQTTEVSDDLAYASHEELIEAAEAEGVLKVETTHFQEVNDALREGFNELYPDIDIEVVEQESDEDQRVLLELAAGQHDYDVLIMGPSSYFDFLEYCEDINMQALVDEGVLTVPDGMINEAQPNTIATGSEMVGNAYNPELVSEEDAPKTYEDFLDPKWKGKIIVNPEAEHVAFLMNEDSWGPETTLDFAEELLANDPVWTDGSIAGLTLMASGEHPLFLMPNYHSALRVQDEQPGKVEVALIEPIGVALQSLNCVRSGSESPAASVLFLEYWASADGQKIMDDIGPVKGSIYAEDSIINDSTEGKETVVYGWEQIANDDAAGWTQQIVELWGFPTAPES